MVEAAVVTGRVLLPDGSPAAGALVRLRNTDAERFSFSASTDRQVFARADGRFLMDSVAPGSGWHVLARLPGFVGGTAGPFEIGRSGQATSPNVVLTAGVAIEVVVHDELGMALSDVTVSVKDRRSIYLEWDPMDIEDHSRVSGADGVATLGPLAPGTHELRVSADGYVPYATRVDLASDDRGPVRKDVTLSRGRVIQGRVLDESDQPVEGARIQIVSESAPAETVLATSDGSGRFEASGLVPAAVRLEVRAEGFRLEEHGLAEGEESIVVRLATSDPTMAARRAELEAERKALFERLMSTEDATAKQALVEALGRVGRALEALREE